jgi:hypothetical protein
LQRSSHFVVRPVHQAILWLLERRNVTDIRTLKTPEPVGVFGDLRVTDTLRP